MSVWTSPVLRAPRREYAFSVPPTTQMIFSVLRRLSTGIPMMRLYSRSSMKRPLMSKYRAQMSPTGRRAGSASFFLFAAIFDPSNSREIGGTPTETTAMSIFFHRVIIFR